MLQVGELAVDSPVGTEERALGDEELRPAVAQHVREFVGFRLRIDDDEDAVGEGRAIDRDRRLPRIRGLDDDAAAAFEAERLQCPCESQRFVEQRGVVVGGPADFDRNSVRLLVDGAVQRVREEPFRHAAANTRAHDEASATASTAGIVVVPETIRSACTCLACGGFATN